MEYVKEERITTAVPPKAGLVKNAESKPEVKRVLLKLEEKLNWTSDYINTIEDRITPILGNGRMDESQNDISKDPYASPLASHINESFCKRVDSINIKLKNIIDAIEV